MCVQLTDTLQDLLYTISHFSNHISNVIECPFTELFSDHIGEQFTLQVM